VDRIAPETAMRNDFRAPCDARSLPSWIQSPLHGPDYQQSCGAQTVNEMLSADAREKHVGVAR
jgi:hypothetical protein